MTRSEKISDTKKRKKKGQEILKLYQNADTAERQKWLKQEQKSYDFFLNSQLTEDEKEALEAAGMPTFVINRITPAIETMKYFATANSPRWKAVGVDGTDTKLAQIHEDIIDYCWRLSEGDSILGHAVLDALTKSKGYLHIVVDPDSDRGRGDIKFEFVDPFDVYVANMSTDPLERDAEYHIIKKRIPKEMLKQLLPDYADIVDKASSQYTTTSLSEREYDTEPSIQIQDIQSQVTVTGENEDIVDYYEVYHPEVKTFYNIFYKRELSEDDIDGELEKIGQIVQRRKDELTVEIEERAKELKEKVESGDIIPDRYKIEIQRMKENAQSELQEYERSLKAKLYNESVVVEERTISEDEYNEIKDELEKSDNILDMVKFKERRIMRTVSAGDMFLYEEELPTKWVPLIPISYLHTGTPYTMSAVTPLVGKQQEINKAHQIMIHNANLASNLRWMYAEGEIDEDYWEQYSSAPGALLRYRPGFSQHGPREIMPQNINNAFFTIEQEAKSDIEYISGIHPESMGISKTADQPYRGLLAKDEFGTRRIRAWIKTSLEPALVQAGRVFMDLAKNVYDSYRIFRITQPNKSGELIGKEIEINVPIYDSAGNEIGRYNDFSSSRYDIAIVPGSTLPLNRWAILDEYKEWFQAGLVDDIAFIMMTDIPDKESLIKRKSMLAQMSGQLEQAQNKIKEMEGLMQTLQRELIRANVKTQAMKAGEEIVSQKAQTKAMEKVAQARIKDQLKNLVGEK